MLPLYSLQLISSKIWHLCILIIHHLSLPFFPLPFILSPSVTLCSLHYTVFFQVLFFVVPYPDALQAMKLFNVFLMLNISQTDNFYSLCSSLQLLYNILNIIFHLCMIGPNVRKWMATIIKNSFDQYRLHYQSLTVLSCCYPG